MNLTAAPDAEAKTDTSDCGANDTHVAQGENNGYFKSSNDDVSSKEDNDSILACEPSTPK